MTLVWGIREDGPDEMCRKAKHLFNEFTREKTQVIVPSVVLAEYLTPASQSAHETIIEEINERFHIKPFDEACTSEAARIFQVGKPMREKGKEGERAILRADTMIISVAMMYGATTLYSGDKTLRALSNKAGLRAIDLPDPAGPLFTKVNPEA